MLDKKWVNIYNELICETWILLLDGDVIRINLKLRNKIDLSEDLMS
jgi:hypothetical protein